MKVTVANKVVNILKEQIVSGTYELGAKLPSEAELCELLSVSRSSLREGLRSLEVAGYIVLKPGRGSFVADVLPSVSSSAVDWLSRREFELQDLLEARRAIEPVCAGLAAKHATKEDTTYLYGFLFHFETAFAANDSQGMADADRDIHQKIAELSKNSVLLSFATVLNDKLGEYRLHLYTVEGNGHGAIAAHRSIVEKLAAHDADGATAEMLAHVNDIFKNLDDITHQGKG